MSKDLDRTSNVQVAIKGKQGMKITIALAVFLVLTSVAYAEDGIRIVLVESGRLPHLPMPSPEARTSAPKPKLVAELKGAEFDAMRGEVEDAVRLLEKDQTWWDIGPDAVYMSAKITLGEMEYTLNSWFPLYRDNPKIAVSETRGLVAVSGKVKKDTIEAGNSKKYKKLVGIFDKAMKREPEQPAEGVASDRAPRP